MKRFLREDFALEEATEEDTTVDLATNLSPIPIRAE